MSGFLEQPQVRVVNASAGSGKTYALSKRFVQLLLLTSRRSPQSLKHILAITFTNKAATQMKERIISLVKRIALGGLSAAEVEDILQPIGLSAAQAAQTAGFVMEDIIRYYHYFNVSTIDSFMNSLLAGCAFKMDLSARFKIKRNSSEYLLLSLDELINAAHRDPHVRRLFERFIDQYLFLENRGNWFPKEDLLQVIQNMFRQNNTYQLPLTRFGATDKDIYLLKGRFIESVGQFLTRLPQNVDRRFYNALREFHDNHPQSFDVDTLSRYFARDIVPVKAATELPDECEQLWNEVRATLNQVVLCEAYAVFNPYVDLYESVMQVLAQIQVKEDILFLEQLNKKAGELFSNRHVSVAEVYYRLATRFDHYLIDEFQDTAQAQWQNIKPLVEEALAHGGSLFYVGDKKQAIYGFRGGKSRLFDQLPLELSPFKAAYDTLSVNYRSARFIVEFNNAVFAVDNLLRMADALEQQERLIDKDIVFTPEDRQTIRDVFASSIQSPKDDAPRGHVRVEIIAGKVKEERAALAQVKVLEAINSAKDRFHLKDIAVLTRNNNEVEEVTGWLMAGGIPARSERTSDIKHHWLIKDLMALLRFIRDTSDNAAFVEFVTSMIMVKSWGRSKEEIEGFLFKHRPLKRSAQEFLYTQVFKEHFPDAWAQYFEPHVHQAGIYPLYEMALNICQRFEVLKIFPPEQGFIMHWLELIKRQEEQGCDLETFLEYFEALEDGERYVPMPSMEAVQVLTIHKAKGLEFDCVIIPFLEMSIKVGAGEKSAGQSFLWDETAEGVRLFRLKESYTRFCELLKKRFANEFKQSFMAELNTMYVALTRAVQEMVIFIPDKTGNSANAALLLIPPGLYDYGQKHSSALRSGLATQPITLPPADIQPWVGGWSEELSVLSSDNLRKRRQGEIIHCCLAQIGTTRGQDLKLIASQVVTGADSIFTLHDEVDAYVHILQDLLQLPEWQPFFDLPLEAQVYCEQEIVNAYGDTRRIDRVIIGDDYLWAVDFKPKSNDEQYSRQMSEYERLLGAIYPGKKVKGFILSYGL